MTTIPRLRIIEEPQIPRIVQWCMLAAVIGSYGLIFGKHYLQLRHEHQQYKTATMECLNERPWVFEGDDPKNSVGIICWRAKK